MVRTMDNDRKIDPDCSEVTVDSVEIRTVDSAEIRTVDSVEIQTVDSVVALLKQLLFLKQPLFQQLLLLQLLFQQLLFQLLLNRFLSPLQHPTSEGVELVSDLVRVKPGPMESPPPESV